MWGGNAQGKTNLLEAIELVLGGELRNGMTERITFGESEAWVHAEVETQFGNSRLEVRLSREGREHKLNEAPASLRELSQLPGAVLLGPDDLELVLGPPEERRRFLDVLLSRFSARYRAMLGQYSRALQQRNALLKSGLGPASKKEGRAGALQASIGIWNQELVKYGSEILSLRRRMLSKLAPLAREAYRELAPGELGLELSETTDPERFLQALEDNLPDDLQRGATSVGPPRRPDPSALGPRGCPVWEPGGVPQHCPGPAPGRTPPALVSLRRGPALAGRRMEHRARRPPPGGLAGLRPEPAPGHSGRAGNPRWGGRDRD